MKGSATMATTAKEKRAKLMWYSTSLYSSSSEEYLTFDANNTAENPSFTSSHRTILLFQTYPEPAQQAYLYLELGEDAPGCPRRPYPGDPPLGAGASQPCGWGSLLCPPVYDKVTSA